LETLEHQDDALLEVCLGLDGHTVVNHHRRFRDPGCNKLTDRDLPGETLSEKTPYGPWRPNQPRLREMPSRHERSTADWPRSERAQFRRRHVNMNDIRAAATCEALHDSDHCRSRTMRHDHVQFIAHPRCRATNNADIVPACSKLSRDSAHVALDTRKRVAAHGMY
jgi:hypothetical protein